MTKQANTITVEYFRCWDEEDEVEQDDEALP
jgi:hypothetical protein